MYSLSLPFYPLPFKIAYGSLAIVTEKKQSKHILIVDDSLDQQALLKLLLEARGYTTDCTSNGEEALCLLRSSDKRPHTILLDLNMPVMGGLDFRRLQRADPLLKDIPVVVMSGEEDMAQVKINTGAEVLKKPLSISSLLKVLEKNTSLH